MKSIGARFAFVAMAGATIAFAASTVRAVTLQELQDGNLTIKVGDKEFSNFNFVIAGQGTFSVDPTKIDVVGLDDGGDYGIRFVSNVPTAVLPIISASPNLAVGASFVDVLIEFDVTVTDPAMYIHDLFLAFDGTAAPDGAAQVVETASVPPVIVDQIQVQLPSPTSVDKDLFGQYKELHIVKDALVWAGESQGSSILFIEQRFSQIPEPATVGLLTLGSLLFLRRRGLRGVVCTALIAISLTVVSARSASAVTLSSLTAPGATLTHEDKLFSNFTLTLVTTNKVAVSPSAIDVSGITLGDEIGIRFAGGIAALSSAGSPNSRVQMTIGFDVEVLPGFPEFYISDYSLGFNGARTGPDAYASVTETITVLPGGASAGPIATVINGPSDPLTLSQHFDLNAPYKKLHVVKVVDVFGGTQSGLASISFIDQTFSQIPEPATLALLGIGLPLLLRRRSL